MKLALAVGAVGVVVGGIGTFLAWRASQPRNKIVLEEGDSKFVLTPMGFVLCSKSDEDLNASLLLGGMLAGPNFSVNAGGASVTMSATYRDRGDRGGSSMARLSVGGSLFHGSYVSMVGHGPTEGWAPNAELEVHSGQAEGADATHAIYVDSGNPPKTNPRVLLRGIAEQEWTLPADAAAPAPPPAPATP